MDVRTELAPSPSLHFLVLALFWKRKCCVSTFGLGRAGVGSEKFRVKVISVFLKLKVSDIEFSLNPVSAFYDTMMSVSLKIHF